jgi:glycosyltransferase involved in cell wall biosynthesis
MINPTFSVIIPAYNESKHIRKCIESVKANDNGKVNYEIIIVDNGSTDGTVEIISELGVNILIENTDGKRKSIGTLRNIGAGVSQEDILAFLDADMVVPDNWFQKAQEYYSNGYEGALGFIEKVPSSAGWVGQTWGNNYCSEDTKVRNVDFLPGRNIFVNRSIFAKIGGFNQTLITAEDKDFTFRVLRAGFKVISAPDISVIHLGYEKNLWEFLKKEFWRQGNTLALAKEWGFSLRSLRNPILSLWQIFALLALLPSIIFLNGHLTILLTIIWVLPSTLLTFSAGRLKKPFNSRLLFFFLTFLRWHISGVALFVQLFRGKPFRNG